MSSPEDFPDILVNDTETVTRRPARVDGGDPAPADADEEVGGPPRAPDRAQP